MASHGQIFGAIPNSGLAAMVQATVKGRTLAGGTGIPVDLTAAELAAIVGSVPFTSTIEIVKSTNSDVGNLITSAGLVIRSGASDAAAYMGADPTLDRFAIQTANLGVGFGFHLALQPHAGGVTIGAPTGGENGDGTLNLSADVYKNNSAYTNPDFVFEHFYYGKIERFAKSPGAADYEGLMPYAELRNYTKSHLRLPGITDKPAGIFDRGDWALRYIEDNTLRILDLNERVAALEDALGRRDKSIEELTRTVKAMAAERGSAPR